MKKQKKGSACYSDDHFRSSKNRTQYAVIMTHSFDSETNINTFASEEEAVAYMQAEYLNYLSEEIRNDSDLEESRCVISSDEGIAQVVWTDGEKTEFRVAAVAKGVSRNHQKKVSKKVLYELYKREWCKIRKWDYKSVREAELNDEEYNGQMYPCFEEFLDNEYILPGYADGLMSPLLLREYDISEMTEYA